MGHDRSIVLYGVGSPLVVDAEESCARAGLRIVAGVRNFDGPAFVTAAVRVVDRAALTDAECEHGIVIALFTPGNRCAAFEDARRAGFSRGATLIDPTSPVARSAEIGSGVYVNAGAVIGGACRLGDWVLVNRSASIGHHARIADYVSIGPGAVLTGNVTIGRGTMIGAGAVVLPEVEIGSNAVIAAGSVVRASIPSNSLAAGNPCHVIKAGIEGYRGLSV
jgi:sugar O-acyltransferase (sialic acid O-acetyltransferase NeuD family)